MIWLQRLSEEAGFKLYAKLEGLNPGGSAKDRPALAVLEHGLRRGLIREGTVIVESSSGNMGIGLAQACRYFGLRFICVVDTKTSPTNVRIMAAYGAELDRVAAPDPVSGELLLARIRRVEELRRLIPNSYWPNQYENPENAGSHYRTTMQEIIDQVGGELDFLFVATSTCGTIRGCGDFARDHELKTRIVAVDAVGSQIFSSERGERLIPGFGAGMRPVLCDLSTIHEVVHVSDLDCVLGCRRLVAREAILAGGSSGGVIAAILKLAHRIPATATCVAILPDRGERYLDTVYNDDWVRSNLSLDRHQADLHLRPRSRAAASDEAGHPSDDHPEVAAFASERVVTRPGKAATPRPAIARAPTPVSRTHTEGRTVSTHGNPDDGAP